MAFKRLLLLLVLLLVTATATSMGKEERLLKKKDKEIKEDVNEDDSDETNQIEDEVIEDKDTIIKESTSRPSSSPSARPSSDKSATDQGGEDFVKESSAMPSNDKSDTTLGAGLKHPSDLPKTNKGLGDVKFCNRDKFFNTTILVEHDGIDMNKETKKEEELLALAMSFADTYNIMNSPNWDENFCDRSFRQIDSIDLQAMGSFERVFEDDSFDFRRIHLYHVSGRCQGRGCNEHSTLFDVEDDRRGRKLTDKRAFFSADSSNETCRCEKGKEDRSPTTEEFSKVFNDTISILFYLDKKGKKFNTSVNSATAIIELQEVPCKYQNDNDSFETDVYVEYLGLNHVEKIESDLKDNLERSFRYSYNDLANLFCDPLNRHVSHVSLREEKIDRRLGEETVVLTKKERRRRRRIRLRIKGRCKGCPRKTPLFNDALLRRALMSSLVGPDGVSRQPLPIYKGPYGEEPLGPSIQRLLKKGDVNRCFCSRFPSIERAPSTDEFAFWYNHSKRLADDVEVIDVHEVPK